MVTDYAARATCRGVSGYASAIAFVMNFRPGSEAQTLATAPSQPALQPHPRPWPLVQPLSWARQPPAHVLPPVIAMWRNIADGRL